MKININKSIEQTYKNEIWKGFTLREVGCAIGALITIGAVAFLAYKLLHLSLTIGVYIGIPFAFPFILLGFKKFSGMTLLQYIKVRKARKDSGILMKTDNLPEDLPRIPFRMTKDVSYGEALGYQFGFDKKTWDRIRRKELLFQLSHRKRTAFREFQYDDPERRILPTLIREEVLPADTLPVTKHRERKRTSLHGYVLAGCLVLILAALAFLYMKGIILFHLPQREAAKETTTAEQFTEEPATEYIQSSDTSLKILQIDGTPLAIDKETQEYEVASSVETVTISAELTDVNAKVSGAGQYDLKTGKNEIVIHVEAEDGTEQNYTISIIRKEEGTTQLPTQAPTQPAVNYNYNYNNYTYYYEPPVQPEKPTVPPNDGVTIIG